MNLKTIIFLTVSSLLIMTSCVSKKEYAALQTRLDESGLALTKCTDDANSFKSKLSSCEQDKTKLRGDIERLQSEAALRTEQINDLKNQREKQFSQVGDLTVLSQSASENIKETLSQLQNKDRYINYLLAARTKTDSINLALAINLKGVLSQGIDDKDVEIKVDKTVVFINLSDKMLYESGSSTITSRANEVLGKIAQVVESRPGFEVMVEGYTDNVPIKSACINDNWDLSVKRATSVVRALQTQFKIDPNRLIAAGRGEYNTLASNETGEGRATNRRTRIIIMPKLNQFYDLLDPEKAAGKKP